ncbi:MAG TPA: type II toxin-antitoxin system Phd/YefM family antitoxin [Polyangiaceae bacterium]|nr:type II toxin-antitoxin system Phd/YefM family antitoxin [Polyangiaceae bacterium]
MMKTLQLQEAKAKLSQIVAALESEGPTVITVRGREKAVLVAKRDYDRRIDRRKNLWSFMRDSPLRGTPLDFERDRSSARPVKL